MPFDRRAPQTRDGVGLTAGALLAREWNGKLERVRIPEEGFAWNGQTFGSLSQIAKAMTLEARRPLNRLVGDGRAVRRPSGRAIDGATH